MNTQRSLLIKASGTWLQSKGKVVTVGSRPLIRVALRCGDNLLFEVEDMEFGYSRLTINANAKEGKMQLRVHCKSNGTIDVMLITSRWCPLAQLRTLIDNYSVRGICLFRFDYRHIEIEYQIRTPLVFQQCFGQLDLSVSAIHVVDNACQVLELKPSVMVKESILGCVDLGGCITFSKVPNMLVHKAALKTRSVGSGFNIFGGSFMLRQAEWEGRKMDFSKVYPGGLMFAQLLRELYWLELGARREKLEALMTHKCVSMHALLDTVKSTLTLSAQLEKGRLVQIVVESRRAGTVVVKEPVAVKVPFKVVVHNNYLVSCNLLKIQAYKDIKIINVH